MNNAILIAVLLILMSLAYRYGTARSTALANGGQKLAALPGHYGLLIALWCGLPALAILILYSLFGPAVMQSLVAGGLPPEVQALSENELAAVMRRITALANGQLVAGEVQPFEQAAATRLGTLRSIGWFAMVAVMAAAAAGGLVLAMRRFGPQLRARHQVERLFMLLLIVCSAVAILTTIGIVLSMVGEALRFFSFVSPVDFFFGTTWNPRFSTVGEGGGSYGLLPLLWGTLMISIIAMLIAIPIGLMIAIYMSQYAHPRLRAIAKPVIEVLAGIPTIVYGFFALTVVGPFFSDVGALLGIEIRATSALTAGVVMGIMIIPFVSSLSDDVITQVPRSMRDGSLALGATSSETVRKVVLRAALPGIVGAALLAVSRAIGETMIVVLAAGNAPILRANPLEAVSTVTVTIVNQLTGDIDFASPQSLVAFALGLTLFVITLGLNVVALAIARKYREQYE